MEMSRTMGPLGLAVAVVLLFAATPAAAQWNPGNHFSLNQDGDDSFTIVLERPGGDGWRFELPSIELPQLPAPSWPPPRGGGGSDDRPSFEFPIALPDLPNLPGRRPPIRPSNAVPEPSAALLFGLGTVVVGQASRRARRVRDPDRS
ncbi:MAG: PEP-CTERM sorting domain-containing protein [bacterium]|nr:PEP-CTERM sorting domain-containing protein [bacterium]